MQHAAAVWLLGEQSLHGQPAAYVPVLVSSAPFLPQLCSSPHARCNPLYAVQANSYMSDVPVQKRLFRAVLPSFLYRRNEALASVAQGNAHVYFTPQDAHLTIETRSS